MNQLVTVYPKTYSKHFNPKNLYFLPEISTTYLIVKVIIFHTLTQGNFTSNHVFTPPAPKPNQTTPSLPHAYFYSNIKAHLLSYRALPSYLINSATFHSLFFVYLLLYSHKLDASQRLSDHLLMLLKFQFGRLRHLFKRKFPGGNDLGYSLFRFSCSLVNQN